MSQDHYMISIQHPSGIQATKWSWGIMFFGTVHDALVSQEHKVLFYEIYLWFFLLFAKFGLKTNALLVENMVMEMFYTGFHIHSKQFSLYLLVMWSSKTYILIILYNNVFSSDSELKIHICVSVQILNWNHYFQFRFLTENLFLSFSSDSELKLLCFQFRFLTEFFFWSLSSDSDLKDSIYIIDLCQDQCTLHTSINCCKERKTKTIILIVFISNIVHFFFFWEHFIVCLWSVRPGDHEWQNAKTAGLKWEGKKGQRLQTEYVFHEHTVLVDLNSIGAKRRNRNDLLWLLLWIKKHIIKTTSLIHIQPRSMQCQGFWFVTLWKAFSTNNVSYQYSIYALHKKTLPDF